LLQNLPKDKRIGGLILVASPVKPMVVEELRQLDHFFDVPFDYEEIRRKTNNNITAIYSTNDHRVPIESGHSVKEKLNPKYIENPEGGHLNEKSGYTEFPLVLEEAKLMMRV
jgi:predicted alpha/beta hydrolase family esterase